MEGWSRLKGRVSSVFAIHLVPTLREAGGIDISSVPPSLYFENANLKATLEKLQSVVDGSGINDVAYAETLGELLLWEIQQATDATSFARKQVRGGLTALQLKRIKEFVDGQISREIAISDLANLAGLSAFHFIRAFKISVGFSPYQYVLAARIDLAKQLLLNADLSLNIVAKAVGFTDTTQLARVFKKMTSSTPVAFRRENGVKVL
jgi:AraC family transcriptional regulator